jgi:hypothetical protein
VVVNQMSGGERWGMPEGCEATRESVVVATISPLLDNIALFIDNDRENVEIFL